MKHFLLVSITFALIGCGNLRLSPLSSGSKYKPKRAPYSKKEYATNTKNSLDYEEYIQTEKSTLPYNERVSNYINLYGDVAKQEMIKHKIPASITLAQGILESGSGNGTLAIKSNNHFGIKCHKGWTGKTVRHDDDEAQECFRGYRNPKQSYEDHSKFLAKRGRYSFLFDLRSDDYKKWALGLKKAGYATDPKYPDKLISLIERYQLYRLDKEVLGKKYKNKIPKQVLENGIKPNPANVSRATIGSGIAKTTSKQILKGRFLYTVKKGDTLYSISKTHEMTVDELKKTNDLTGNYLSIGQQLIIPK